MFWYFKNQASYTIGKTGSSFHDEKGLQEIREMPNDHIETAGLFLLDFVSIAEEQSLHFNYK